MRTTRLLAGTMLLISGATGLVYELVWSKYLADALGNSGQAHAVVLATYMGGLALGAALFGRLADRVRSPLALYAALELGVGLYALVFPALYRGLQGLYLAVAPDHVHGGNPVWPKLLVAALALLLPTLLMGGTLPAMLRFVARRDEELRPALAGLYAVNSLGAAAGALGAGAVWIPSLGLRTTSGVAALYNVALAAVAWGVARRQPQAPVAPSAAARAPLFSGRRLGRAALAGVLATGLASMLLEVAWIRLLTLVLGASTYAFTLILTAFIAGIGLGSFWASTRMLGEGLRRFGLLLAASVGAVCLTLPLYVRLPHLFWRMHHALERTPQTWAAYQGITFAVCCLVLLLPTFVLGAAFPIGARVALQGVGTAGRRLGAVYAFNTVGTVLGALAGSLWVMPRWGMEGCFALALGVLLAGAAVATWFGAERPRDLLPPIAAGAALAVWLAAFSGWGARVANLGAFREYGTPFASAEAWLREVERDYQVDFVRDDTFATVVVGRIRGQASHRYLRINGKVDASTGERDIETQVLGGHLGPLLAERVPQRVLVVGAGTGMTVGALLAHPVQHVDVVEISPAVVEAMDLFKDQNGDAARDPRVHVHVEDARTFLAMAKEPYDLIVSYPSNPWVSGVSGLITREFLHTAAERLAPDGTLVQWVHTYEISADLLRLVVRTVRDAFPWGTSWGGGDGDLVMVMGRRPRPLDLAELDRRVAQPRVRADLSRIGAGALAPLLARQLHADPQQAAFAGKGPLNTDDRNRLEYGAPVAFFLRQAGNELGDARRFPADGADLLISTWLAEHPLSASDARAVHDSLARFHGADDPLVRAAATRWVALAPDDAAARAALARVRLEQGEVVGDVPGLPEVLALRARVATLRTRVSALHAPPLPEGVPPRPMAPDFEAQDAWDALCALTACPARASDPGDEKRDNPTE